MTRSRTWRVGALLAAAALIGAACGGGDDDDDDGASGPATAVAAVTREAATVASGPASTIAGSATSSASSSSGGSAASSAQWDAVVAAAEDEGKVTFYTAQGLDQANQVKAAFEDEHPGITVDVVRDISSNLIPKLEAERQTGNGIADVYVSADTAWWATTAEAGHVIPMTGPAFDDPAYDRAELVHDDTYFEVSA